MVNADFEACGSGGHPTDSQVKGFLVSTGIQLPVGFSCLGFAASAVREFEKETGWVPFLQAAEATTRTYDPPGPRSLHNGWNAVLGGGKIVQLGQGICSAQALVCVAVQSYPTLVLGKDFRLLPQNAPTDCIPYSRMEFFVPQWGAPDSIAVTAYWGRVQSIPEDVFAAELRLAAALALDDLAEFAAVNGESVQKEGDEQSTIDPNLWRTSGSKFRIQASRVIGRYRNICVGI